jgi:cysteine desulfurase/selenocysteine lyase
LIAMTHAHGVPVLVDGAQSTPHIPVNVRRWTAISSVLWPQDIRADRDRRVVQQAALLEEMPPGKAAVI